MTPLLEQARRALCDSNKELLSVRNSIGNDRMPHDGDEFHERLSANVAAIKALEAEQAQQVAVPAGYVLVDGAVIEHMKAHWHLRTDWETYYYPAMQVEKLRGTQPPQGDKT